MISETDIVGNKQATYNNLKKKENFSEQKPLKQRVKSGNRQMRQKRVTAK